MVGPPTAAAAAGSTFAANTIAFATNPITLAILGAFAIKALADKFDDPDNFRRSNAGFLISDVPGANTFDVPAFDSGFDPIGFSRRTSMADALAVIAGFRAVDSALTASAVAAGLTPNLGPTSFGGFNEEGEGNGLFFGVAGGDNPTPLSEQLRQFASQWIIAVGGANQIPSDIINSIASLGSAEDIVNAAASLVSLNSGPQVIDGSFAGGLSRVPRDGFIIEAHANEEILAANDPRNVNNSLSADNRILAKINQTMETLLLTMQGVLVASNATADALDEAVRNGDGSLSVRIAA